jgi:alpha-L-fucosidase
MRSTSPKLVSLFLLIAISAAVAVVDVAGVNVAVAADSTPNMIARGGNDTKGFDMAPETRLAVVEAAVAAIPVHLPDGPFKPTWDSLKANYKAPAWFADAKFGLFMHWGLYSVPAHGNEWYEKHMYSSDLAWHTANFGPPDVFGYKDFIPKFTQEKFDPVAWAELFKKSGARYVIPTAQHHDGFALWDSQVTAINAKQMGPHRDLIGELCKAVRARGLKFGVSNHGIENFQFINPSAALKADLLAKHADLYDPKWAEFYHVADRSDAACQRFLVDWAQRNVELIDKYQPEMLWFDNGVDQRYLDPLKLWVAAYYYNRAAEWGKPVSLSTKKAAYSPTDDNTQTIGSIIDFEKIGGRSPSGIRAGEWQVDEPIGSTWGFTTGMRIAPAGSIIAKLIDTVSKNGNLLLNLSPQADGTISQPQQDTLLEVGKWLEVNGDAIYGTHAWTSFEDPREKGDKTTVHFTVKGDKLYAIVANAPEGEVLIKSLGTDAGQVSDIRLLGSQMKFSISQGADGLRIKLPSVNTSRYAVCLEISGIKTNPSTFTESGNPR